MKTTKKTSSEKSRIAQKKIQSQSSKPLKTLTLAGVLFTSPVVIGQPIYWEAPRSAIGGRIFESQQSACDALDEAINYPEGDIKTLTPPSLPERANWSCTISAASGRGSISTWLWEKSYDCAGATTYDPFAHQCVYATQNGKPEIDICPGPTVGNPINLLSTNKVEQEFDLRKRASNGLEFYRTYNSTDGVWRHNFATRLEFYSDHISVVHSDGRGSFFQLSTPYSPLSATETGRLTKTQDGWMVTNNNGNKFEFNDLGQITSISDASNYTVSFARIGKLTTATSANGDQLEFSDDPLGQPLAMTANGTTFSYIYDGNQRLKTVTSTRSGLTTSHSYLYEHTSRLRLLTGLVDENGARFASWTYDVYGKPIASEHADGTEKTSIVYNADGSAVVTNAYGKKTTYTFQGATGSRRITSVQGQPSANCPYSNSSFTYDSKGLLKTLTDAKGHLSTYDYNDRGLETSRTEASGTPQARSVLTEWHPTLFLKTKVTEPDRITTYQYDAQGRQTGQIVTPR
ncbi:DUF6531 domain-containing protein [Pseudomonas sp. GCEP-101]|uniref:DUF6531 domain-containing protein n=1 Tax=Pseudomonas sp. GCEP-101 TaxID=2974552 RepID=UPI00223BD62F|nr:DUF6531 domain-containing protein [Pseudomonas sp. GCEP-101]